MNVTAPVLRPLNIGEIFDRAITIYMKNFAIFTLVVLAVLGPIGIAQAFVTPDEAAQFQQIIESVQHPSTPVKATNAFAFWTPGKMIGFFLIALASLLLAPFANNAVAVGVAAVYSGRRPDFRRMYGVVFGRWARMLATCVLEGVIFITGYVGGIIVLVLLFALGVAVAAKVVVVGAIVLIVASVASIAFLVLLLSILVQAAFALYAVALENAGTGDAVSRSFSRLFNRQEFWKMIVMSLAFVAIESGVAMIGGFVGLLVLFGLHSQVLEIAINTTVSAILAAFVTVLLSVYYYDVRTRQEGLDIQVDMERLAAAGSA